MWRFSIACLFVGSALINCGTQLNTDSANIPSGAPPLVLEISPDSGGTGTLVTVRGLGYSLVPQENIIHLGSFAIVAETYTIVPGREELTFTVPAGLATGLHTLFVTVVDEPSNADMNFRITP